MSNARNIFVILPLLLWSCIDPYEYAFEEKTNYLVVEGRITTEPGPHEITLTSTRNIRNKGNAYKLRMQNARVTVGTSSGRTVRLVEKDTSGIYYTPADFRGAVGEKYQLNIELEDGREYLSDSVELLSMPEFDSVGIRFGTDKYVSELNSALENDGFFVDAYLRSTPVDKVYYTARWRYTYLINTAGQLPRRCWITISPFEYGVFQQEMSGEKTSTQTPLFFLPVRGVMFGEKIRVEISLFSESSTSYRFRKAVYSATFEQGGVFDPTPAFIPSNIRRVDGPEEIVLGQFSASEVRRVARDIYAQDYPGRVDTEINWTEPCLQYVKENHSIITDIEPEDWNE
jgi:hypothetical protein